MAVDAPTAETEEQVRAQIAMEREQLVVAVDEMRAAADPTAVVKSKLPLLVAVAFRVEFQSPERTLTDADAARLRERIVASLADRFGAELRA